MSKKKLDPVQEQKLALLHDYKAVFGTPQGKRVLQDLMAKGGLLQSNYVPGDSHGTAYNEGARSLVLHIFEILRIDLKQLQSTLSEGFYEEELVE